MKVMLNGVTWLLEALRELSGELRRIESEPDREPGPSYTSIAKAIDAVLADFEGKGSSR